MKQGTSALGAFEAAVGHPESIPRSIISPEDDHEAFNVATGSSRVLLNLLQTKPSRFLGF